MNRNRLLYLFDKQESSKGFIRPLISGMFSNDISNIYSVNRSFWLYEPHSGSISQAQNMYGMVQYLRLYMFTILKPTYWTQYRYGGLQMYLRSPIIVILDFNFKSSLAKKGQFYFRSIKRLLNLFYTFLHFYKASLKQSCSIFSWLFNEV